MEKQCSCKKLIKEDKITLITECNFCIKKRRKDLKSVLSVLDKLIELKKLSIPKYKTSGVFCAIVNDSKEPTPKTPEYYKNWLESLKPKSDFNKQMLGADKELQRVCKTNVCTHVKKYKFRFYNKEIGKAEIQNRCFACDQLL